MEGGSNGRTAAAMEGAAVQTDQAKGEGEEDAAEELMATISAHTVATLLRDPATRGSAIDTLEARPSSSYDEPLARAAIVGLTQLAAMEEDPTQYQRIGWLRGRLVAESANAATMWGIAWKDGRMEEDLGSKTNALCQTFGKAPEQLEREDALTYAAANAMDSPGWRRGIAAATTACWSSNPAAKYLATLDRVEPAIV